MTGLLSAWIAELVLIAYRGSKTNANVDRPISGLALPSEYASTFVIFGALAFVPGQGQRVAGAIGWGLVVATFLNLWTPGAVVNGKQQPPTVATAGTGPGTSGVNMKPTTNVDTGHKQTGG